MGPLDIHDCELPIIITIVNIYTFGHRQDFPDSICALLKPVMRGEVPTKIFTSSRIKFTKESVSEPTPGIEPGYTDLQSVA